MLLGAFRYSHSLDRSVTFFCLRGIHTRSHRILPKIQPQMYVIEVHFYHLCLIPQDGSNMDMMRMHSLLRRSKIMLIRMIGCNPVVKKTSRTLKNCLRQKTYSWLRSISNTTSFDNATRFSQLIEIKVLQHRLKISSTIQTNCVPFKGNILGIH